MLRLVQGDVGCGKTWWRRWPRRGGADGPQVALMAPTELLADQHAQNFRRWFEPLGVASRC
jgi:ATP-dependent DNA helicase RecG